MSEINITVPGGTTKRLLTAGKYCPADILVTAEGGGGRLPSGYTELEYIESSGTQYVDTGVLGKSGLFVKSTFVMNSTGECMLLGCYGSYRCFPLYFDSLKMYYGYYTNYPSTKFTITAGQKYSAEVSLLAGDQSLKIDGETKITSSIATNYTNTRNLYLFAYNNNGSTALYASAKLYDLQIYDNGTLVRDYVPCRNPYGGVGLYDLVNGQFYGNAGTGEFVAGVAARTLPVGYTKLEYIQSSGTQYVDTDVVPKITTRVDIDFMLTSTANAGIVGYMESASAGNSRTALFQSGGAWYLDFGGQTRRLTGGSFSANKRHNVGFGNFYVKDLSAGSDILSGNTVSSFVSAGTISVCCEVLCGIGKWYSCQIYDNGVMVRDYIPCRNANGTNGLFDVANSLFYGNAGDGVFVGHGSNQDGASVSYSVNTSTIGTTWQVYPDINFVPQTGGNITVIASHSSWSSGTRYFDFTVTGATAMAVGGSATSSPALTPTNKQAQFTIELSDITGDIQIAFTNVRS